MTVGIPGSIVFEMAMQGNPLPSRVQITKDAAVMITRTIEQALAMEALTNRSVGRSPPARDQPFDLPMMLKGVLQRCYSDLRLRL
jgi:hypothetical protein